MFTTTAAAFELSLVFNIFAYIIKSAFPIFIYATTHLTSMVDRDVEMSYWEGRRLFLVTLDPTLLVLDW